MGVSIFASSGRFVLNVRRLVICDRDKDYCAALAEYMRRSDCGYEVITYSDPMLFCTECAGEEISLLLIQEEFLENAGKILAESATDDTMAGSGIAAGRRFVLTESREAALESGNVYKYQSAACIVGIIGEDIEAAHRIVNDMERCEDLQLIGVYSPLNHTLKTTFSMTLGQIMAEEGSVLYINMEGYNGLTEIFDIKSEYALTDLFYEYSLHPEDLSGMLARYTVRSGELNLLLPARSPFELQETEPAMWMSLIGALAETGRFGTIILDISDSVRGVFDLLNVCTKVYMPVRKDGISMAKLKDFEFVLSRYPGAEGIKSKLKRLKFPYFDDVDPNMGSLKNSRLGRYIRQELIQGNDTRPLWRENA